MRRQGFNVTAAKKWQGSIEDGIEFIKTFDIVIHPRCRHIIDEFNRYSYKVDKQTGDILPVIVDAYNHCLKGDTLVSCADGDKPIKDVCAGDYVYTRKGLKKVLWSGKTRENARVFSVCADGYEVTGTADHKIFTHNRGWVAIGDIQEGDVLLCVETVEAYGKTWHRYPDASRRSDREYFKNNTTWLHRYTWEQERDAIPPGMVIHHKDGNCQNNSIDNLECVSPKDHRQRHPWDDEQLEKQRAHMADIRPLTVSWHKSAAGHEWHKQHAKEFSFGTYQGEPRKCKQCGREFVPKVHHNQFCSNACKSAWRRAAGIDDVERTCPVCGTTFTVNKYSKKQCCSKTCSMRKRWRDRERSL
jgi:hypothetical protein